MYQLFRKKSSAPPHAELALQEQQGYAYIALSGFQVNSLNTIYTRSNRLGKLNITWASQSHPSSLEQPYFQKHPPQTRSPTA